MDNGWNKKRPNKASTVPTSTEEGTSEIDRFIYINWLTKKVKTEPYIDKIMEKVAKLKELGFNFGIKEKKQTFQNGNHSKPNTES